MWEYIRTGSDPSAVQVLLEDSSSVLGTLIAGTSLTMSWYYQMPIMDAAGSVAIGGLLSAVALFLLRRNMDMIVEVGLLLIESVWVDQDAVCRIQ
jgi:zinc transporter 9